MDCNPEFKSGSQGSFPGRGGYEFAFQYGFEGSNEEKIGRGRVSIVKNVGKCFLRRTGL